MLNFHDVGSLVGSMFVGSVGVYTDVVTIMHEFLHSTCTMCAPHVSLQTIYVEYGSTMLAHLVLTAQVATLLKHNEHG